MSYSPVHGPEVAIIHEDTAYDGEVNPGTNTPRTDTLRWSENESIDSAEKQKLSRETTRASKTPSKLLQSESWTLEIISLVTATAALGGIIGTLGHFDGRALPDWPYDITLSALIALPATIANANLAVPLQSGLSQLKWIRFKAGRTPLADMEVYDEASRGTWGALKLLVKRRGGIYGSFGAVLAIIALSLGPFAQQISTYRSRMVEVANGAAIPRALNYTGYLPGLSSSNGFVPILPMKSAVYSGLFAESNDPGAALNVTCSTGNCTFTPFETLGICTSCVDMSQIMTRYCQEGVPEDGNVTSCGWELPGRSASLNTSSDVFSMTPTFGASTGSLPYSTLMRLTFMGTESRTFSDVLNPWAQQCTLSACIQTLQSSVTNGILTERLLSTQTNTTVISSVSTSNPPPLTLTSPTTNTTFLLASGSKLALEAWFSTLFRSGSATRSTPPPIQNGNVLVNLTVGVSSGMTFFDTDITTAFYWMYYEHPSGIERLMSDLATSMTVAMRSFVGAVPHEGQAWAWQSFVHVRWGFVAVPVATVVLTGLFLGLAVWRSRRGGVEVWKSSALALLCFGLDGEAREMVGTGRLGERARRAKGVSVSEPSYMDWPSVRQPTGPALFKNGPYGNYSFTGEATRIGKNPSSQITYAGCRDLCGVSPDYYTFEEASSTITTWILPIMGIL
ncbi:hypothetical protein BDZ85DRAFT_276095 [Elsinoe ampelina]|uniref:Uncharacterized protein n=1 Tax=Elsinoe ampelina TaxID=302913 RepID=A0A6A6G1Z4_9PEZI|nr:hypothetical protein BDZ85DRAFT_276095 [Elsinoe ampelina]